MSVETFTRLAGVSRSDVDGLLNRAEPISLNLARGLASVLGSSVEFWVTRDCQFRDDQARVDAALWMNTMPIEEMARFGWIRRESDWTKRLGECLSFFNVESHEGWQATHDLLVEPSRFRLSPTLRLNPGALSAWLRRGEILAEEFTGSDWSPSAFRESLVAARNLTRVRDPAVALTQLASICTEAGVTVILLRPPSATPVSGAARFLSEKRALILLSGRYLSDDHLWFTFFHEAGHLLLHDSDQAFVDSLDPKADPSSETAELEANNFAQALLVGESVITELRDGPLSVRRIARMAKEIGVAPGILVGQLQHAGMIGYGSWNGLKRHYRWAGTNLETA